MNPDLNTLSGFVSAANEWEQAGTSPRHLLEQTLPLIQRIAPTIRGLRLWLLQQDTLMLRASAGSTVNPAEAPAAIPERQAVFDSNTGCWQVALRTRGQVLGILEAVGAQADDTGPLLEFIAQLWAAALERHAAMQEMTQLAQMSRHDDVIQHITTRLQNVSRVEQMLVEAANGLREALDARRVTIRLGTLPTQEERKE